MSDEVWKPVFGGNYEISSHGRFRRATAGNRTFAGKIIKPIKAKNGYLSVRPIINGKHKQCMVHRIVAEAFIGPCPAGLEVNHIDGNKQNHHVSNLEYVTHAENLRHARVSGLCPPVKISDETVRKVRELRKSGMTLSEIAKVTGVSKPYCWNLTTGNSR